MLVLGGDFPVLIAFSLAPEFPVARFAPHVRFSVEEVLIQLYPGSETKKTREASIVVAENMVVLQMHLERKWSKEGAQTEIALDLVVRRVIDVVPQGVAVLKHLGVEETESQRGHTYLSYELDVLACTSRSSADACSATASCV